MRTLVISKASQYYRDSTIYPSVIAIIATLVFMIVDNINYKSEWLTSGSVIGMSIVTSLVYALILSALCLPILLVKIEAIHKNKIWAALSWFLVPFIFITTVLTHEIKHNLRYNEKLGAYFYVILLNLPFVAGLIWTYLRYRKDNYLHTTTINSKRNDE